VLQAKCSAGVEAINSLGGEEATVVTNVRGEVGEYSLRYEIQVKSSRPNVS